MIPPPFLDLPTIDTYKKWPIEEGFLYLGYALRIEYLTTIHNPENEVEIFFHEFATGVRTYEPSYGDLFLISTRQGVVDESRDQIYDVKPAVDPIVFGLLEQLVIQTPEGRKLVLASPYAQIDFEEAYFVGDLSEVYVAWDAEAHNLVIVTPKGDTLLTLREGNLGVVESGMIVG